MCEKCEELSDSIGEYCIICKDTYTSDEVDKFTIPKSTKHYGFEYRVCNTCQIEAIRDAIWREVGNY